MVHDLCKGNTDAFMYYFKQDRPQSVFTIVFTQKANSNNILESLNYTLFQWIQTFRL